MFEHMGGGGPQATRIPRNPVGSPGFSTPPPDRGPRRSRRSPARPFGLLAPPLVLMAVIWALSAQPDLSSGLQQDFLLRKLAHVAEFAVLTLLWARALAGLLRPAARRAAPWGAAAIAVAWAAVDERHQHFVEGRVGSVRDVAIDAIGVVVAVAVVRWTPLGRRLGGPGTTTGREDAAGAEAAPGAAGRTGGA